MKTVVMAVLLLLAVASIVSGDTAENFIDFDDSTESGIVSDDIMENGKSPYGGETFLAVILQTLRLCKIASLLNYELRHDE
jgi:hypothetical protein